MGSEWQPRRARAVSSCRKAPERVMPSPLRRAPSPVLTAWAHISPPSGESRKEPSRAGGEPGEALRALAAPGSPAMPRTGPGTAPPRAGRGWLGAAGLTPPLPPPRRPRSLRPAPRCAPGVRPCPRTGAPPTKGGPHRHSPRSPYPGDVLLEHRGAPEPSVQPCPARCSPGTFGGLRRIPVPDVAPLQGPGDTRLLVKSWNNLGWK